MAHTLQDNLQELCNLTKIMCYGVGSTDLTGYTEEHLYSVLTSLGSLKNRLPYRCFICVLLAGGFWTFVKGIFKGSLNSVNLTININKTTPFQPLPSNHMPPF